MVKSSSKTVELSLPSNPKDPILLGDWLEIYALLSTDVNSSKGDLEAALRTGTIYSSPDAIESVCLDVFTELESRTRAAGIAYPFQIKNGLVQQKGNWKDYPAYVFCLCLSYFGCKERKGSKAYPRRWFEHLARDAARYYLGEESLAVRFGTPRLVSELPSSFKQAINKVCKSLKEGEGFKGTSSGHAQDDAVDIIAWKHFPDGLPGKVILFGNCATQRDWDNSKARELNPEAFCLEWMRDPPRCKIIKSYFIPHRVKYDQFLTQLRYAGVIFDRCRIAHWSYFAGSTTKQKKAKAFFTYHDLTDWAQDQLNGCLHAK